MFSSLPTFSSRGGRKAVALTAWNRVLGAFGAYRRWQQPDWKAVDRLVFICKGNICRSAYGHAYASQRHGFRVASAGLEAREGARANDVAQRVAGLRGVDLSGHRAQAVNQFPFRPGDLLVAFEPGHLLALERALSDRRGIQMTLMGVHARPSEPYMHDPYGLADDYFANCFLNIERNVGVMTERLEGSRR